MFSRWCCIKLCCKWKNLKEKIFDNIWIQPAAGDAIIRCSISFWHIEQSNERKVNLDDDMQGSYLGTEYSQEQIEKELKNIGANFEILKYEGFN